MAADVMDSTDVLTKETTQIQLKEPGFFAVVFHNDDSTSFDFVIEALVTFFGHSVDGAVALANKIHHEGSSVVGGPYTREVAEEKKFQVTRAATVNRYPLKATVDPV